MAQLCVLFVVACHCVAVMTALWLSNYYLLCQMFGMMMHWLRVTYDWGLPQSLNKVINIHDVT